MNSAKDFYKNALAYDDSLNMDEPSPLTHMGVIHYMEKYSESVPASERAVEERAIAERWPKEFTEWYNGNQQVFMESKFNMAEIAYAAWQMGKAEK